MLQRTPDVVQSVLNELRQHQALSPFHDITPDIQEWGLAALHFAAHEISKGQPVIIKAGVSEGEIYWTTELARVAPDWFPKLFTSGRTPSGIGFLVSERVSYGPFGPMWQGREFDLLLEATAHFYRAAQSVEPQHLPHFSFGNINGWLSEGSKRNPPGDWQTVLTHAEQDYAWLSQVWPLEVCHGDLHLSNGLSRSPAPDGPAVLIDLEPVLGFWILDAAYLEVLTSGNQERPGIGNVVPRLASFRQRMGLPVPPEEVQERATRIALSWLAIKQWNPNWTSFMPDFETSVRAYVDAGASLRR